MTCNTLSTHPTAKPWTDWLATASGHHAHQWFLDRCSHMLADVFGYYAFQLGLPHFSSLQTSRIRTHCLVQNELPSCHASYGPGSCSPPLGSNSLPLHPAPGLEQMYSHFEQLPLPSQSVDLITLPHTLDMHENPPALLAEVARVLVPEGHVWIGGFNAHSLWAHQARRKLPVHTLMTVKQLKTVLQAQGLYLVQGQFGVYRPWEADAHAWDKWRWMDLAGHRWWPAWGACYSLLAIKRVSGLQPTSIADLPWSFVWKPTPAPAVSATSRKAK
jgi:hypothetical protein